jgi:hypothetical protein
LIFNGRKKAQRAQNLVWGFEILEGSITFQMSDTLCVFVPFCGPNKKRPRSPLEDRGRLELDRLPVRYIGGQ